MESSQGMALFAEKSQDHEKDEEPEGPLGGDQMEPVEGRRNRMKADPSLDPLVFHDGRPGDVAGKSEKGRKDVTSPDPDEIRCLWAREEASQESARGCPVGAPDEEGRQVAGQGEIDQDRHGNDIGVHEGSSLFWG